MGTILVVCIAAAYCLRFDPAVGLFQSLLEGPGWPPAQFCGDELVGRISAPDPERTRDVLLHQAFACNLHGHIGQLIDADHLVGADVDGSGPVGAHQPQGPLQALLDVEKRPGLFAVTPDLDFAAVRRHGHLATDGGRGLFAPVVPGAVGAEDVVVAGDTHLHALVAVVG